MARGREPVEETAEETVMNHPAAVPEVLSTDLPAGPEALNPFGIFGECIEPFSGNALSRGGSLGAVDCPRHLLKFLACVGITTGPALDPIKVLLREC